MQEDENIKSDFMKRDKGNPFKTPDHYFESMEDRIIGGIRHAEKNKTKPAKMFQLLKPALGLVASFSLIYLLVYYPINTFLGKTNEKMAKTESSIMDSFGAYSLSFSLVDENSLVNTIFGDDQDNANEEINQDEVLAYLSSDMNEVEIYSAIQN